MKKIHLTLLVMVITSSFAIAQVNLNNGLVASYYFSNNYYDNSGNGYNATNLGTTFTNDRFGNQNYAIYFNGSSYVNLPNDVRFQPLTSATLSFWMKASGSNRFIVFEQRTGSNSPDYMNYSVCFNYPFPQYAHYTYPNYNGTPYSYTSYIIFSSGVDGNWHHFVFTKDVANQTMSVYQDNILLGTRPIQDVNYTVSGTLRIGKEIENAYPFIGYIDDIRIYSRTLNTQEIAALYNENTTNINVFDENVMNAKIFPNPTSDKVSVSLPENFGEVKSIELFNVTGQMQKMFSDITTIDISSFNSGLYFLVITNSKEEKLIRKVVKK